MADYAVRCLPFSVGKYHSCLCEGVTELENLLIIGPPLPPTPTFTPTTTNVVAAFEGDIDVEGLIDPIGIVFDEQSSAPFAPPVAGRGQIWVRDDSPNVPMFTDDVGTDFNLLEAAGGSVTLGSAGGSTVVTDGTGPTLVIKGISIPDAQGAVITSTGTTFGFLASAGTPLTNTGRQSGDLWAGNTSLATTNLGGFSSISFSVSCVITRIGVNFHIFGFLSVTPDAFGNVGLGQFRIALTGIDVVGVILGAQNITDVYGNGTATVNSSPPVGALIGTITQSGALADVRSMPSVTSGSLDGVPMTYSVTMIVRSTSATQT